jgi:hypothetical protein
MTKREKIINAMLFFTKLSINYPDESEYFDLALKALDWQRMLYSGGPDVDEFYRE